MYVMHVLRHVCDACFKASAACPSFTTCICTLLKEHAMDVCLRASVCVCVFVCV